MLGQNETFALLSSRSVFFAFDGGPKLWGEEFFDWEVETLAMIVLGKTQADVTY